MGQETSDPRDRYHAALTNLFDEVTHDPAFDSDPALHDAAITAQSALGKVEQRLDSPQFAENTNDKRIVSDELQKAETELDTAAIEFLRKSVNCANADTAVAALELLKDIPADVSKKYDLNSVKSGLDIIILKHKKASVPKLDLGKS